jgi:hypothetical protein
MTNYDRYLKLKFLLHILKRYGRHLAEPETRRNLKLQRSVLREQSKHVYQGHQNSRNSIRIATRVFLLIFLPITVAARYKACPLKRWDRGLEHTQGTDVCLRFFCVCFFLCR